MTSFFPNLDPPNHNPTPFCSFWKLLQLFTELLWLHHEEKMAIKSGNVSMTICSSPELNLFSWWGTNGLELGKKLADLAPWTSPPNNSLHRSFSWSFLRSISVSAHRSGSLVAADDLSTHSVRPLIKIAKKVSPNRFGTVISAPQSTRTLRMQYGWVNSRTRGKYDKGGSRSLFFTIVASLGMNLCQVIFFLSITGYFHNEELRFDKGWFDNSIIIIALKSDIFSRFI